MDSGEWVYGDLLQDGDLSFIVGSLKEFMDTPVNECLVKPDTVGQYTGFKDRTGMDIYEGDIIRYMNNGVEESVVKYECAEFSPLFCLIISTIVDNGRIECDIIGNIHDNPDLLLEKQQSQSKGVVLFGYQYLYQNGDLGFHEKMAELGLSRGDVILGGLPNKCILANKHEYFLVDYYKEEDFCEQYKLKATYSVDDFIQGIKELK